MRTIVNASDLMPEYIYMPLPTGEADVFIYKPTGEENEYESNEFRTKRVTEEEIAKDPFKYLDYEEKEQTLEEKVASLQTQNEMLEERNEMLEECLIELANIIYA